MDGAMSGWWAWSLRVGIGVWPPGWSDNPENSCHRHRDLIPPLPPSRLPSTIYSAPRDPLLSVDTFSFGTILPLLRFPQSEDHFSKPRWQYIPGLRLNILVHVNQGGCLF